MATINQAPTGLRDMTRVSRRHWVRSDKVVWPFVWRGLLPVLGLLLLGVYAVWPFAHDEIEATVLRETRARLDAAGYRWAEVSVSGQQVTLSGLQPAAGDAALAAAREAACPSWAGRLICAVEVTGQFADAKPQPAPLPAGAAPSSAQAGQACETALADIVGRAKIEFGPGSADIDPGSAVTLDALARIARECPGVIRVEGHSDVSGAPEGNLALSEARAAAVRAALIERGLPQERLQAQGFGTERPIADNNSAAGRAQNRRIEFRVVPGN